MLKGLDLINQVSTRKIMIFGLLSVSYQLFDQILDDDMGIDPLGICGKKIKERIHSIPEPFAHMIDSIEKSIEKNPGYLKFIGEIEDLDVDENTIKKCLHHMLLLDSIVQMMIECVDFKNEMIDEIIGKRRKLGLSRYSFLLTIKLLGKIGIFNTVKLLSVDASFRYMSSSIDNGQVPKRMLPEKFDAITLNILEAVYFEKNKDNNILGRKLAKDPPIGFKTQYDSSGLMVVTSKTDQKWVNNYLAWNLVFIMGNQGDFDILLPKLIIPSVISTDPGQFMFRRVYSLWLSINFCLFRKLQGTSKKATKFQKDLAKKFSKIEF